MSGTWGGGGPDEGPAGDEPALVTETVTAWRELLAINPHARDMGGKACHRVWASLDALTENRSHG